MLAKIITPSGVTVHLSGYAPFTMTRDHKLFNELESALKFDDEEWIIDIIHMANKVEEFTLGNVKVVDGELFYKGQPLHGTLTDRILSIMGEGEDATYLLKFLENLMLNPSYRSREQLYGFLENCADMPITEDGRFIAYKWVNDDYTDCHTKSIDNSVGSVVTMPRSMVDDDPNRTCSAGLHVCSRGYTKFGTRLMLVAVNPKDVVSVPTDYNNSKMRVCQYEVIQEIEAEEYQNSFKSSIYRGSDEEDEDEIYYDDYQD